MYEITKKIVIMTFKEFKEWDIPKGWKMLDMSGRCRQTQWDRISCFEIEVTLQKENENDCC